EGRGVLGGVGEDRPVGVSGAVERGANGGDLAVHHARGRDHVGAGRRLRGRDPLVDLESPVIFDLLPVEDSAVAMVRVLAESEIGYQQSVATKGIAQLPQRALHDPVLDPRTRPLWILGGRNAEEHEAPHAQLDGGLGLAGQRFERVLNLARHGFDRLRLSDGLTNKERVDQILGGDPRFAGQPAEGRIPPHPAGTLRGKAHAEIGARLRTMASTKPRVVYSWAMISTRIPRSRAVCAVIGPMQAMATLAGSGPSIASTKCRTVEELVKVIISTRSRFSASR